MLLAGMFFKIFTFSDMTEVQSFTLMIQNQMYRLILLVLQRICGVYLFVLII